MTSVPPFLFTLRYASPGKDGWCCLRCNYNCRRQDDSRKFYELQFKLWLHLKQHLKPTQSLQPSYLVKVLAMKTKVSLESVADVKYELYWNVVDTSTTNFKRLCLQKQDYAIESSTVLFSLVFHDVNGLVKLYTEASSQAKAHVGSRRN